MSDMTLLVVRLQEEEKQDLALRAEAEGRSMSGLVRYLIRQYLRRDSNDDHKDTG